MKSSNILVLMEWYDHRLREGIGRYAAEKGWYLSVNDSCLLPQGWNGDGILTLFNNRKDIIKYIKDKNLPCVDMGYFRLDIPMPRISGDHRLIGKIAADHLIDRGFQDAAYFSSEYQTPNVLRGEGFSNHFQQRTGSFPRQLIWEHFAGQNADNWEAQFQWLIEELHTLPKPLAVFCYCDYDAAKLESICLKAGYSIPDEIAILGVDNDGLVCDNIQVPISSVRHDLVHVGYRAAALLDHLMKGGTSPETPELIPPRGIELRASTDSFTHSDPLIRKTLQYFRKNIARSIGVDDAAEALNIQRHKLENHFDKVTGQSVYATLLKLRIFEVKRMLKTTDQTIKNIAQATGFCHAQHLNSVFKSAQGCTPSFYRKHERSQSGSS